MAERGKIIGVAEHILLALEALFLDADDARAEADRPRDSRCGLKKSGPDHVTRGDG